jgi:GNAT superfamily N-acetyltransferase
MAELSYSQLDSERFGLNIYRVWTSELDIQQLLTPILANNVDTAIVRFPSTQLMQVNKIDRLAMPFMITDTLAYYNLDIQELPEQELVNQKLKFVEAGPAEHTDLNYVVREVFGQYVNHYRVNPSFDNEQVTLGYQDWVRTYAEGEEGKVCWLLKEKNDVVGFSMFNLEQEERISGILYGVKPTYRRREIFKDIMRHAINYGKEKGKLHMRVSTQIENIAVQKAWTHMGFTLHHHDNTLHINSMLSRSVFDKFSVELTIDEQDLNTNKVSNRHILKQINYHLDFKRNIITQNHRFVNLHPLKPNQPYRLAFSFPTGNKGVCNIRSGKGETHALVYFDLKHFIA